MIPLPEPIARCRDKIGWLPSSEVARSAWLQVVPDPDSPMPAPRVHVLSLAALKHAQRFAARDAEVLAMKLYLYHRVPLVMGWKRLWPDPRAVLSFVETACAAKGRDALGTHVGWSRRVSSDQAWLAWHRRPPTGPRLRSSRHKLYVSPEPTALGKLFPALFASIGDSEAVNLKIGAHASNLLRPDKIVVYFDEKDDLLDFAERLLARTAGVPAQGVPFSFPVDCGGLVSWGVDPLAESDETADRQISWRWSLCQQVALTMVDDSAPLCDAMEPWRRAVVWLRRGGMDARVGFCPVGAAEQAWPMVD